MTLLGEDLDDDVEGAGELLRTEPDTVAAALDLYARLSALGDWIGERKTAVRNWTHVRAEQRRVEDDAAPTWRMADGSVSLSDPDPTPRIVEAERFARWWLIAVENIDPDRNPYERRESFGTDLGTIVRRRFATASSDALLDFLDRRVGEAVDQLGDAADWLSEEIDVDVEWLLPADALAIALDPKHSGRLRLVDGRVVDVVTAEAVPGVEVAPAAARSVTFRPTSQAKTRIRGELDDLLGPAALTQGTDRD